MTYPWYEVVDSAEPLGQGDLIRQCPILLPTAPVGTTEAQADVLIYDVVVMTQACDLANRKAEIVLLQPFHRLAEFAAQNSDYSKPRGKERLRKGLVPRFHLLNAPDIEGFTDDFLVVDFMAPLSSHYEFLAQHVAAGERLRLLPPYREHLSQAYARFLMRIGLPTDIPEFK